MNVLFKEITLQPPIKLIETTIYMLVIQDATGLYHYINKDGTYDGYSRDLQIRICYKTGKRCKYNCDGLCKDS